MYTYTSNAARGNRAFRRQRTDEKKIYEKINK